jgi:hypothetical protein
MPLSFPFWPESRDYVGLAVVSRMTACIVKDKPGGGGGADLDREVRDEWAGSHTVLVVTASNHRRLLTNNNLLWTTGPKTLPRRLPLLSTIVTSPR